LLFVDLKLSFEKWRNIMQLDRYDRQILELLQQDGRISNQDLADRIGLSPSPCLRRVRALEESGLITGYRACSTPKSWAVADGADPHFDGPAHAGALRQSRGEHRRNSGSARMPADHRPGADYQLKVVVRDMDAYQELLLNKITRIQGVTGVHTSFVLRRVGKLRRGPRCFRVGCLSLSVMAGLEE
jgi:Lrp/AsnC family leucine-responsive transcriptional regulator